jgi:hypothetical protein
MTLRTVLPRISFIVENVATDRAAEKKYSPRTSINVLLAGSSPMQLQLLTAALRRRPEFSAISCPLDADILLETIKTDSPNVVVFAANANANNWEDMALLRRLHVAYPRVAQILLVESVDRELVVNAFRSGIRGLFCVGESPFRLLLQMHPGRPSRPDLGQRPADQLPARTHHPGAILASRQHTWQQSADSS